MRVRQFECFWFGSLVIKGNLPNQKFIENRCLKLASRYYFINYELSFIVYKITRSDGV